MGESSIVQEVLTTSRWPPAVNSSVRISLVSAFCGCAGQVSPAVAAWWEEAEDILTCFATSVRGELVVLQIEFVGVEVYSFTIVS